VKRECISCKFCNIKDLKFLLCRRYPPVAETEGDAVDTYTIYGFPRVDGDDWCGEYVEVEPNPLPETEV